MSCESRGCIVGLSVGIPLFALSVLYTIYCPPRWLVRCVQSKLGNFVVFFVPTVKEKLVTLTLDDGPTDDVTCSLLEVLKENGVQATMFFIGERINMFPTIAKQASEEGHEICNHGYECCAAIRFPTNTLQSHITRTNELIQELNPSSDSSTPRFFRPGSGWFNKAMVNMLKTHFPSMKIALGDVYPHDPRIRLPWWNACYVYWMVQPGSVIILHDGFNRSYTVATLRYLIPWLKKKGYKFVTLSKLCDSG
eukprot:PhF_6_TR21683/c0_g1_i3/m.30954